jgi:hypothetical protein
LLGTVATHLGATKADGFITSLGHKRYSVPGHTPVKVGPRENEVLQAFLLGRTPLSKKELGNYSGLDEASAVTVLRSLKGTQKRKPKYHGMFSPYISMPGKAFAGGYHVSIANPPKT